MVDRSHYSDQLGNHRHKYGRTTEDRTRYLVAMINQTSSLTITLRRHTNGTHTEDRTHYLLVMVNQTSSLSITLREHKYGSATEDGTLLTCNSEPDELVNHYNKRTHV